MPAEIKSKGAKVETITSPSLRKRYQRHCKKVHNLSVAQRLRDMMQLDLKNKIHG